MIPVGEVFKFKEEIEKELTPSFHSAVMSSLGKPYPTSFGDANYVFRVTCFTEPLKRFIEEVLKSLNKFGTTPFPLVKGFGFGKTHSLIVLWHIFTSNTEITDEELRWLLSENTNTIKQTFILACDVKEKSPPLKSFIETLFASKNMEKDYDLLRVLTDLEDKTDKNELLTPAKFVEFLVDFVNESKKRFQKIPKFLILIDELGWGLIERIDEYADSKFTKEDLIEDVRRLISFVVSSAEKLKDAGSSVAIVYALAEQDMKSFDARIQMYYSNENVRRRLEGLKELIRTDLIERLKRHSGGIERAPLQLNPLQNIEIAKFRVLEDIGDEKSAKDAVVTYIQNLLENFKIFESEADVHNYIEIVKQFYPISPDLIYLFKKAHNSTEFPKTEYVRTIISLLKEAVKNALQNEPDVPLIGVRFLSLQQSALYDILDDFAQTDWFEILKDLELAIEKSDNRRLAEQISKLIVSKATTSNILALMEERELEKYGTSQEDIQASIVSTFSKNEVSSTLEYFPKVLTELRIRSARIIERTVNGKKIFIPSPYKHVIAQRESYIIEEKKLAKERGFLNYLRESRVHTLLNKLSKSVNVLIKDFKELKELSNILLTEPTCFIDPPWDFALFSEIERKGYDAVIKEIVDDLNDKFHIGQIIRAPYLIVLIPNLAKVNDLVESIIEYNASLKFLDYLKEEEAIIKSYVEKIKTEILTRRAKKFDEKKLSKHIIQSVQQQIREAKNSAMAEVVRCAREVIANLLRLYEKPIVYNLTDKKFTASTMFLEKREETIKRISSEVKTKDIDKYADMIRKFIEDVLSLVGFEEKVSVVTEVLLNRIKKELEEYELENISVDELLENLIIGTYGVLPKTEEVAKKAIDNLNGKTIDYPDKIVKIIIDKKLRKIKFEYQKKEPKMRIKSVQVSPKKLSYNPREVVRISAVIINEGAKGDCIFKVEGSDGNVITEREINEIDTMDERSIAIELTLPETEGEYSYKLVVMHNPVEVDDEYELTFDVKEIEIPPPPPPPPVKKIIADITDANKDKIIEFVSKNQNSFDECEITMESDDFDISIDVKSPRRDNLDILIRFIQPLAKKCNATPKISLKVKHGVIIRKEDIDFEAEIYD